MRKEKRIDIRKLKEGMLITEDVYNRGGLIIVPENTVVTKEVLSLLDRHSVVEVFIGEDYQEAQFNSDDLELLEDAMSMLQGMQKEEEKVEEFKDGFQAVVEKVSQSLRELAFEGKDIDIHELMGMVNSIVEIADNEVNLCDMLLKRRQSSEGLCTHLIIVSLYARMLAGWLNMSEEEVELAGMAGLLHDIGLLKCQQEEGDIPLYFHDEFDNEIKIWERHVVYGYNMIKDKNFDYRVKDAVLTHHERMDYSGFPYQSSYRDLNKLSRVLAIADTYATMTLDEPDYEVLSPLEALRQMQHDHYIRLDSDMLMLFIERMAQNFIQHEVILSNGQKGRIIMINHNDQARPLVQVEDGFVDLSKQTDITIQTIVI